MHGNASMEAKLSLQRFTLLRLIRGHDLNMVATYSYMKASNSNGFSQRAAVPAPSTNEPQCQLRARMSRAYNAERRLMPTLKHTEPLPFMATIKLPHHSTTSQRA